MKTIAIAVCCLVGMVLLTGAWAQQYSEWAQPVNLGPTVNSSTGDFHSCISKDGLTLYFTSARPHGNPPRTDWDIWVTHRASIDSAWGAPENLGAPINSEYQDGAPSLSVDGHRLYFHSNRPGGYGGNDLYVSFRKGKRDDARWEEPQNLGPNVNTNSNEATPWIHEDDANDALTIYFSSDRPGGPGGPAGDQGNDIYAATKYPWDETFEPAILVPNVNTEYAERAPTISRNGMEMFISSDRPPTIGPYGFLDILVSTRTSTYELWSVPMNMGEPVNSYAAEARAVLSFDGTALYFQSSRAPTFGAYDLWVATREKLKGNGGHH